MQNAVAQPSTVKTGAFVLRITIPKAPASARKPRYVSPATAGMRYVVAGPTHAFGTVSLEAGATGCTIAANGERVCALRVNALGACPAASDCYKISAITYDRVSCTGSACTIPRGAKPLSAALSFAFAIVAGKIETLPIALDGIAKSVAIVPVGGTALAGSVAGGFALSKCLNTQAVDVFGLDADGNRIVGAGAPTVALRSDKTAIVAIASPVPSPDSYTFTLTGPFASATPAPSAIPSPGATARLTATVTPLAASGGSPISAVATLTVNHDVCGVVTRFPIPTTNAQPYKLTKGPDGNLWFSESAAAKIGRLTLSGTITEFPLNSGYTNPGTIVTGSDGNLYFGEYHQSPFGPAIGRITTGGAITDIAAPAALDTTAVALALPHGDVWFSNKANGIVDVAIAATPSPIATPIAVHMSGEAVGLANASNGHVWFTAGYLYGSPSVGQVDTAGNVTQTYALTDPKDSGEKLGVTDANGNFWFVANDGDVPPSPIVDVLYEITPAGKVSRYVACCHEFNYMTLGPDGAIWLDAENDIITRVSTTGQVSHITYNPNKANPFILDSITTGPDDNLWFTEQNGDAIDRMI